MSFFSKSWAPAIVLIMASIIALGANAYEALYAGHVPVIETEPEESIEEETETGDLPEEDSSSESEQE